MKSKKKKRNKGNAEIKVLMVIAGMVATLGFWNFFSQQDKQALLASQSTVSLPAESPPAVTLDLPPVPTLLPPGGENQTAAVQPQPEANNDLPLRSVSAPAQSQTFSSSAPLVVGGSRGGGGGGGTTRTRSS